MEPSPPDVWKCFGEFMAGFTAARELHSRAGTAGSFVECVCLGAALTDAMLRIGLVLREQLDNRSRDIPLELIVQGSHDKAIAEREIYRRALTESVIDDATFAQLQALYDKRNRVIHRYIISRITTAEVLDIAIEYERMIETLAKRTYDLEEQQIRDGVGITVRGPALEGEEGKRFLEEFADEKHGLSLAKVLRGK
jgi:cytosine/adenosine deaminase-related metal-dependent hydrolase